jgi:hypothetical protein
MFEWIFALFHFFLFSGLLVYSIYVLVKGSWFTGLVLLVFLVAYYLVVLHKAMLKEIHRKNKKSRTKTQSGPDLKKRGNL